MTPDVSWQPLSIDSTGTPPPHLDRTGAVALIPCGDRAWAAGAAVTLARSLARGGRRVFLCDLDLATPRLHTMVGLDRGSGVSDFILYGASPSHVSVELEERLLFVSAGTPVTSYEAVYGGDRWDRFVEAATHARASLLFLVPADVRGASRLLARAETLVALGSPGDVPDLGDAAPRLRFGFHRQDLGDWAGAVVEQDLDGKTADSSELIDGELVDAEAPAVLDGELVDAESDPGSTVEPVEAAWVAPDAPVEEEWHDEEWTVEGTEVEGEALTPGVVEPDLPSVDDVAEVETWTLEESVETAPSMVDDPSSTEAWAADDGGDAEDDPDAGSAGIESEILGALEEGYSAADMADSTPSADDESIPVREAWVRGERPGRARGGVGLWVILFLVVVVAILVAGWMGWIDVPGISPRRADLDAEARIEAVRAAGAAAPESPSSAPMGEEVSPPVGDAFPDPAGDPGAAASAGTPAAAAGAPSEVVAPLQGWALRLGAFRGRAAARNEADRMAARAPSHLFVVVPVEVGGTRWYRVVSGLAADRNAGERLRADLALALQSDDADQWLVRRAPLAFLIDERDVRLEADGRVAELRRAGIDAYVMAAARTDGSTVFRVYAGAFADAAEAATLRELLESLADLAPPLVERRGTRPE